MFTRMRSTPAAYCKWEDVVQNAQFQGPMGASCNQSDDSYIVYSIMLTVSLLFILFNTSYF